MKKLLVLVLVLSMATMASASLRISVNGEQQPSYCFIGPLVGQTFTLGIWTDAAIIAGTNDNFYFDLVGSTAFGTIDYTTGNVLIADNGIALFSNASAAGEGFPLTPGIDGISGGITLFTLPSIAAGTQIFDGINYTASALGFQTLLLYESIDGTPDTTTLVDTVSFFQDTPIPEPMTLGLLGLGGLILKKRKT